MRSRLFLIVGIAVLMVGCADTSQEAAPEATDATEVTEAPEAPDMPEATAVVEAPDATGMATEVPVESDAEKTMSLSAVRTDGDSLTITIVGDGTEPADAAPTTYVTVASSPPSHNPVYLISEKTAALNLPFSEAVRVGHLLFLSGQIGTLPGTTDLAPGGIQGEARQTMENIKAVLEANGSSMDRVVKATVMLLDISEWPAFNEVYVDYFPGDKPARSAFAGSGLALGARCEVEVIAVVDP